MNSKTPQAAPPPDEAQQQRLFEVIYKLYRNALLNRKYYGYQLQTYKTIANVYEISLAFGASGTIGAWAFWESPVGHLVWSSFLALTAVLNILKPFLRLPAVVERYSKLHTGHTRLYYDLSTIVTDIGVSRSITPQMADAVSKARESYRELALEDDVSPNEKLRRKCYEEVVRET